MLLGTVVGLTVAVTPVTINDCLPRYYSAPYLGIFIDIIEFIHEIHLWIRAEDSFFENLTISVSKKVLSSGKKFSGHG